MTRAMRYGRAVRMARAWAGFKQAKLAGVLGVRAETLSSWENGRSAPSLCHLSALGEACGVPLETMARWGRGEL